MNFDTSNHNGMIFPKSDKAIASLNLSSLPINLHQVEIPVTFLGLSIGPKELANVTLQGFDIDDKPIQTIHNVGICKYDPSGTNTIAGEQESTPIKFDETQETETKVLRFFIDDKDGHLDGDGELTIRLNFQFRHSRGLDLVYKGNYNKEVDKGSISNTSISRESSPTHLKINLLSLVLLIVVLSLWKWLGQGVYSEDNAFWSTELITLGLGSLVTFLGLTLTKLKISLKSLFGFSSIIKYPEIHLNLEQFIGFNSTLWSIFLTVAWGLTIYIIGTNFPLPLKTNKALTIYESEGAKVKLKDNVKSLYYDDVKEGKFVISSDKFVRRLGLGLVQTSIFPPRASVIPDTTDFMLIERNASILDQSQNKSSSKISPLDLLNKESLGSMKVPMSLIHSLQDTVYKGRYHIFNQLEEERKIVIEDYKEIRKSELEEVWVDYQPSFQKTKKERKIFRERFQHFKEVSAELRELFKGNSRISRSTLEEFTRITIQSVHGEGIKEKKIHERIIFLMALWETSDEKKIGSFSKETIEGICQNLMTSYHQVSNHRVAWTIGEFLLQIHKNIPVSFRPVTIKYVKNHLNEDRHDQFAITDLMYIVSMSDLFEDTAFETAVFPKKELANIKNQYSVSLYESVVMAHRTNGRKDIGAIYEEPEGEIQQRIKDYGSVN